MKSEHYYVCTPGGTPIGPFDRKAIEAMIVSKQIHPDSMFCEFGKDTWLPRIPHQGKLQARSVFICLGVSALAYIVADFTNLMKMSAPAFLGSWIGGTIGYWGLGGLSLFFSSRVNVTRNWVITILILASIIILGRLVPKVDKHQTKPSTLTVISSKTGRTYTFEFERTPTLEDIQEAVGQSDAASTR